MLIDTHCHLNFSAFKEDADLVIKRAQDHDIWMINIGSQYETSKRAVELAEKYEKGIFAAIGLHPIHLEERKVDHSEVDSQIIFKTRAEEFDYQKYKELAKSPKVVAIGEIGLDYWYKPKTKKKLEQFKEKQKETFLKQLNLAKELNLPVILHCRMAHDNLIQTLQQSNRGPQAGGRRVGWSPTIKGVIHCFTGDWQQAKKFLELGFYFGFNGLIFKKIEGAPDWQEIIKKLPIEKILLETDAPYLTPPLPADLSAEARRAEAEALAEAGPFENQRNEPLYVKYIAQKIAELKNINFEKVAEATTQNAKELFKI